MTYLLFQIKDLGFGRMFSKEDTLTMEIRNLQVYENCFEELEFKLKLVENIGSFGRNDTPVNCIKGMRITYNKDFLFILLGFKLDPNFTFKASVNKDTNWLCVKPNYYGEERGDETWLDFARYGATFTLIEYPLFNDNSTEATKLKELINYHDNKIGTESKEKLERCQLVESSQLFNDYKKKLNDRQLIRLSNQVQQLTTELQNEKDKNFNLQQEVVKLQDELTMEREEVEKALEKAKEWRERQLKEITEQKDRRIAELELILEKQTVTNELESQPNNLQIQEQDSIQAQIEVVPKK